MIRTDSQTAIGGLIGRLIAKAERAIASRASILSARAQTHIRPISRGGIHHSHPWRNASSLWPDLFKD